MNKKERKYIMFLILSIMLLFGMEIFGPQEADFTPDFTAKSNKPYGCSAMYGLLDNFFGRELTTSNLPFYNVGMLKDSVIKNYLVITYNFNPDALDVRTILDLAYSGNNIFVSAFHFNRELFDTLKIHINSNFRISGILDKDTSKILIRNNEGINKKFEVNRSYNYLSFDSDTNNFETLGTTENGKANFIKIELGKGAIFLNTQPLLFANYHFLKKELNPYSQIALNYLPDLPTVWDAYYKPNKNITDTSMVRFILKSPALRWAWYILLAAMSIYLLFGSRRKQRKIPVLVPPQNTSLEFTKTLGQLYFQNSDHIDLVKKKMQHMLAFIYGNYFISKDLEGEEFYSQVAQKTGNQFDEISYLFKTYNWIVKQPKISDIELTRFVGLVNQFYEKCKN